MGPSEHAAGQGRTVCWRRVSGQGCRTPGEKSQHATPGHGTFLQAAAASPRPQHWSPRWRGLCSGRVVPLPGPAHVQLPERAESRAGRGLGTSLRPWWPLRAVCWPRHLNKEPSCCLCELDIGSIKRNAYKMHVRSTGLWHSKYHMPPPDFEMALVSPGPPQTASAPPIALQTTVDPPWLCLLLPWLPDPDLAVAFEGRGAECGLEMAALSLHPALRTVSE